MTKAQPASTIQRLRQENRTLRPREGGAIAIMFAGALVVIIAACGLALDLSRLYNRKMELQNVADTLALAAAIELNGTDQGILNALQKVNDRFGPLAVGALTYQYGTRNMTWSNSAIQFGTHPSGPWYDAGATAGRAESLLYAKIDTKKLDSAYGQIELFFMRYFSRSPTESTSTRAIAGHSALKVTPLGICTMRDEAQRDHNGELEEYGFRRGVAYNLLGLARDLGTGVRTYLIDPLPGAASLTDPASVAPFVCTGTVGMSRIAGGKVAVVSPFPLSSLYYHLNSRFGMYTAPSSPCNARTSPPDANVKEFTFNGGSPWMGATPMGQSAALHQSDGRRWTVAGPDTAPAGTTAPQFGPLWSYAKAAKYASYSSGAAEPAAGYSTYTTADWATLYFPGAPTVSGTTPYPSAANPSTPYAYNTGTTFFKLPPTGSKSVRHRRVLNVALLACPVSGNSASVLAIGKFFMTVPATDSTLVGEFAGLASEPSLRTQVELYP